MYFCHVKAAVMCCKELLKRMEPAKKSLKDPTWQEWTQEAYKQNIDLCATYLWVGIESFFVTELSYNKVGNVHINNIEACLHNDCCHENKNHYYIFWVCVCSLSYPEYKANALYYIVICGMSGFTIFFHIIS